MKEKHGADLYDFSQSSDPWSEFYPVLHYLGLKRTFLCLCLCNHWLSALVSTPLTIKKGGDIQEADIPLACEVFNLPYLTIFFSQWGVNTSTISSEKQSHQTMNVFISWSLTKPKVCILFPDAKSQDEISKWSTMCLKGKWRPDNKGAGF